MRSIALLILAAAAMLLHVQSIFRDAPPVDNDVPIDTTVSPFWDLSSHKVESDARLLSILVAIYPSDEELGYLDNQLRSFAHFFEASSIQDYLLITPRALLPKLQAFARKASAQWGLPEGLLKPTPEDRCCGQLHPRHPLMGRRENGHPFFGGWVKQQVVKLACAKLMRTPFYLILDADVLFSAPLSAGGLFRSYECDAGSPVCSADGRLGFQSVNDAYPLYNRSEEQRAWMRNAARTLQLSVPVDWRVAQGVTPQVVSAEVAMRLGRWIEARFMTDSWTGFLLDVILRDKVDYSEQESQGGEKWSPPWTEFTLYWIFASHSGVWDDYHSIAKPPTLSGSVWARADFDQWRPCERHAGDEAIPIFTLVQSSTGISSAEVWARFEACLSSGNGGSSPASSAE